MAFLRDLFYGFRLFRRSPAFYLLGVLIISLGVGGTTAIFSLINGVLLNELPYRDSERLTVVWSDFSRQSGANRALTAPALFFDWRERSQSFASMAAFVATNRTFTALDRPITSLTHEVTPNFFDVAGVQVLRGRTFLADEGLPGRDGVVLISYSLWRSAFAGSESAVGSSIELDGRTVQIVGVLPSTYRAPYNSIAIQPGLFVPASFDDQRMEWGRRSMVIMARLRDGVSIGEARAEIAAITTQIARENPEGTTPPGTLVNGIREDLTGEYRRPFFLLQTAVGIMLLIACANVANLLLTRYSTRGYEFCVRTAIGASRGQLVRQLLASGGEHDPFGAGGYRGNRIRRMEYTTDACACAPGCRPAVCRPGPGQSGGACLRAWIEPALFHSVWPRSGPPGVTCRNRAASGGLGALPQRRPIQRPLAQHADRGRNRTFAHSSCLGRTAGSDLSTSF
jgi:putative ABC transport system permease protein